MAATHSADHPSFGAQLRRLRAERAWSLRDLAERITYNRGYIGKVEQGEKFPERQFAERADQAFGTRGALVGAWEAEASERHEAERTGRLLSIRQGLTPAAHCRRRATRPGRDQRRRGGIGNGLPRNATRPDAARCRRPARRSPATATRTPLPPPRTQRPIPPAGQAARRPGVRRPGPGERRRAITHAQAAWTCAEHAGGNELRAWTRGTQSLIARFQGNYAHALD
ncbi:helix-turn-helix domain-containing protein [Micromonospora coerulea]|uniref:helix-turn-helix domain-containing protein n=1 Tax=Micromonospora coerulea TaxID=47856 RepID=UPI003D155884